jgi:hypothetical protein
MNDLVAQKQYLSHMLGQVRLDLAHANDGWRDEGLELSLRRVFHNMALKCRSEIAWIRVQLRKVELDILQMELVQVRDEGLFVASVLQDPECADLHHDFRPTWGDLVGRQTELVQEIAALRSQV